VWTITGLLRRRALNAVTLAALFLAAPPAAMAAIPAGNLLANPGAELGTAADDGGHFFSPPGWNVISRATQVHYTAGGGFPDTTVAAAIGGGAAFFAGGPVDNQLGDPSQHSIYQAFDLTPYATEIDRGNVRATLSGLLGGYLAQGDATTVTAHFTLGDSELLTLQIGPVTPADRGSLTTLINRSDMGLIPTGARRAEVDVNFDRAPGAAGTYNDAYADNLALTLRDETPPVVHTTSADNVTNSSARIGGTIDDLGTPTSYHVEFGTTTAYGQRSGDATTAGAAGAAAVSAALGGLQPDSDYHARLVADGPTGPVAGEDVSFHTGKPDLSAQGLPAGLDFTWSPRADVQIAGAPLGGLQFSATPGDGVSYAWDFDYRPDQGLRPDPGAAGDHPRHGFSADGAHDTAAAKGADGQRRRVYSVRLRATAPNGASAEVTHDLVVMPNSPPKVEFLTERATTGVNKPVTFTPQISDPDATPRTADRIDHIEWDFDTPAPGHANGELGGADLICDGDGSNCRLPADGSAPGAWVAAGPAGQVTVNFWQRGLAAHALSPLSLTDLNTLPLRDAAGAPLEVGIAVRGGYGTTYVRHDPRAAYLYDNATLLQQSSFDKDAGEATGAQLRGGAVTRKVVQSITQLKPSIPYALASPLISWRQVTLTAVDSAGARSSTTHTLTLTPDAPPKLVAQFVNRAPDGSTSALFKVKKKAHLRSAHAAQASSQTLDHPLTTDDELAFDASGTADSDDKIEWYVLEVGKTWRPEPGFCQPAPPTQQLAPSGQISIDPNPLELGFGPGQYFSPAKIGGTGPGAPIGPVGSLPIKGLNPKALQKLGLRATPQTLPTLGDLLATKPLTHDCTAFKARTVLPEVFKVRPSGAARPAGRASPISTQLLKPLAGLEFDTTAIVTRNPQDLRFRIPTKGTYSVSVAAYDSSGQGAIQRTDGFEIKDPDGSCANLTGEQLNFASRPLGFGGLCLDFGHNRQFFWSTHDIDVNGVTLRPLNGAALFISTQGGHTQLFATRAARPNLNTLDTPKHPSISDLAGQPGAVAVVVDGDQLAKFPAFSASVASAWIRDNSSRPSLVDNARYKGSPVARPGFSVTFDNAGQTTTAFAIVLPRAFSRGDASSSPTADIVRHGIDEPRATILTTNKYADIARKRRVARARAAAINLEGTIDLSGTTLGPVSIQQGTIKFDAAAGNFAANISKATLYLPEPEPATFHLTIENGDLKEAGGSVGTNIPLFPSVTLSGLRFSIITEPLTLSGGASFAFANLITGDLDLTVRPKPLLLRLQGTLGVGGLELGRAYVQFDAAKSDTLTFGGHFGYDFGPAALTADVDGGISFDTGDFFVQGSGHACLWLCLDVRALISNVAVAACGSVDFGLFDVSAGFAYRFNGGLKLFTGCDLEPYKPAVFKSRSGLRADNGTGGTIAVAAGTEQLAVRFVAPPGQAGAPKVTITGPDGHVYATAGAPGDYVFSPPGTVGPGAGGTVKTPGALIDQDPVDHVSTFLLVHPPAGDYQVSLAPGQPALASTEVTTGKHLPDDALQAQVQPATLSGASVAIGSTRVRIGNARASAKRRAKPRPMISPKLVARLRKLPRIEQSRLRGVILTVPAGLSGKLTLLDVDIHGTKVLRTLDLATNAGKVPLAFDPSDTPGQHQLQAFITHSDGVPRQVALVDNFTGPALPPPSPPGLDLHRDGSGTTVLDVTPGNAGGLSALATSFDLVAATSSGKRIERLVDVRDARSLGGGRFRVVLGDFARGETVKASGHMVYANVAGTSRTDTMRGHGSCAIC
jgi:hypothetical protein